MEEALHQAHLQAGMLEKQGGTQGPALSQIHEFKKGQVVRIARHRAFVQEVEKRVEEKREILRQAAIEYKIIEPNNTLNLPFLSAIIPQMIPPINKPVIWILMINSPLLFAC